MRPFRSRSTAALLVLLTIAAGCGSTVRQAPGELALGTVAPVDDGSSVQGGTALPSAGAASAVDAPPRAGAATGPVVGPAGGSRPATDDGPTTPSGATAAGPAGGGGAMPAGNPADAAPGDAAPQAPGAGAHAPPAAGTAGQEGVGYSAGEIHLGILAPSSASDEQLANAGFGGVTYGDSVGRWEALVADLNERGGVTGRQVEAQIATVDVASPNPSADRQAACSRFSQDTPVFAVLSLVVFDASFHGCLQDAGIPAVAAVGAVDQEILAQHPLTVVSGSPTLGTVARSIASGLATLGFFDAGDPLAPTKIGLLRVDLPAFERAAQELDAALAAEGLAIAEEVAMTSERSGDYGAMASQASGAVLRFRAAGVTHVLFLTANAFEPTLFMSAAVTQDYRPRYGLSSQQFPNALRSLVDHSQLQGAGLVGWAPVNDVPEHGDTRQAAALRTCLETLAAHGHTPTAESEQLAAAAECELAALFALATDRAGVLDGPGFIQGVGRIGADLPSPVSHSTAFSDVRRTGPATYRPGAFDDGCGCFIYTGAEQPLAG